jgi:hypothetical protein
VQRPPFAGRSGQRDEGIVAERDHRMATLVEPRRHVGVTVAKHELHATLRHQVFAGARMIRERLDGSGPQPRLERAQPAREEGDRQRVRDGEAQARRGVALREPRLDPRRLEARHGVADERQELAASLGQLDRVRPAVDQVDADPFLARADVARERGLRHQARLGRTGEVAALRERQEIFDPLEIEGSVVGPHQRPCQE